MSIENFNRICSDLDESGLEEAVRQFRHIYCMLVSHTLGYRPVLIRVISSPYVQSFEFFDFEEVII